MIEDLTAKGVPCLESGVTSWTGIWNPTGIWNTKSYISAKMWVRVSGCLITFAVDE